MKFKEEDRWVEQNRNNKNNQYNEENYKLSERNYKIFKEKYNIVSSTNESEYGFWTALRPNTYTKYNFIEKSKIINEYTIIPYEDHSLMYKDSNSKRYIAFHSYGDMEKEKDLIIKWCEEKGLKADFYNKEYSWYYPNQTYVAVVYIDDNEKYKKYINNKL
jgi:hypothetical protein